MTLGSNCRQFFLFVKPNKMTNSIREKEKLIRKLRLEKQSKTEMWKFCL